MALIADGLLLIAALSAAFYCRVLALRLRQLGDTDRGLGGVISTLNTQVEEMKSALGAVAAQSDRRADDLSDLCARADLAARRLDLLLAALEAGEAPEHAQGQKIAPTLRLSKTDQVGETVVPKVRLSGISRRIKRSRSAAGAEVLI
jgi:hypothetical protein